MPDEVASVPNLVLHEECPRGVREMLIQLHGEANPLKFEGIGIAALVRCEGWRGACEDHERFSGFAIEPVTLNYRLSGSVTPARQPIITGQTLGGFAMGVMLTSYKVSQKAEVASATNGHETSRSVLSRPGFEATLILTPDGDFALSQELGFVYVTLQSETESPPDVKPSELVEWLRARLIVMLNGPTIS